MRIASALIAFFCLISTAYAEPFSAKSPSKIIVRYAISEAALPELFAPSENHNALLENELAQFSIDTLAEYSRIFSFELQKPVPVAFLPLKTFRNEMHSPEWAAAIFTNGSVYIGVDSHNPKFSENLRRSVRHELVHAYIAEQSAGRCPAWLDEGLAQFLEGKPNPRILRSVQNWAEKTSTALDLQSLENGFLSSDKEAVALAYGQAFLATRALINSSGLNSIRQYLNHLRAGHSDNEALLLAFGKDYVKLNPELNDQLLLWSSALDR